MVSRPSACSLSNSKPLSCSAASASSLLYSAARCTSTFSNPSRPATSAKVSFFLCRCSRVTLSRLCSCRDGFSRCEASMVSYSLPRTLTPSPRMTEISNLRLWPTLATASSPRSFASGSSAAFLSIWAGASIYVCARGT